MLPHLLLALSTLATALELPSLAARDPPFSPPTSPFTLTYAFTFTLALPPLLPEIHPQNSNGTVAVSRDLGGTINGPLLNGTLSPGGLGSASRFATYYVEDGYNFGTTDDNTTFFVRHAGVGNSAGKVDRFEIIIDGKYAYLSSSFFLQATETNVTAAGGTLRATVYLVGSTLQAFP